jgi:hypothetical protein
MNRDSDTHPKDGDVEQAPLVSGAGPSGHRPNSGDNEELVERLRATSELVRREPVLVADQDPFIELWNTDACLISEQLDQAATLIEQLHNRVERLENCSRNLAIAAGRLNIAADGLSFLNAERRAVLEAMESLAALTGEHNG